MSDTLILALINKNALSFETVITATYNSRDLFGRSFAKTGDFKIGRILNTAQSPILELTSMDDSTGIIKTNASSIYAIDGMALARYADLYDIMPDGSSKKVGRKRGRKPKPQLML